MPAIDTTDTKKRGRAFTSGVEISGQFALVPHADFRLLETMRTARGVPVFICAPNKTGRTSLALDYAQRQYELDEVLWIDAAEEGFLEAVNTQTMFEHLKRQIANGLSRYSIVVIDDLPLLDNRATSYFSDWVDQLIDDGIEVIIITTPQEDNLMNYQSDRLLIEGKSLVISQKWSRDRIAGCLKHFFLAPLPQETHILAALMITMGHGNIDNLKEMNYQIPANAPAELRRYCPLIGIDEATGSFDTRGFPTKGLSDQLIHLINQAPRSGLDAEMSDLERSFERLTQMSVYLYERAERVQSQMLLELAGSLLTCDDAGFPLSDRSYNETYEEQESCEQQVVIREKNNDGPEVCPDDAAYEIGEDVFQMKEASMYENAMNEDTMYESSTSEVVKPMAADKPEQLIIRLFGDFKVLKGDKRIEGKQLQRSKVRTLLIHLALNMGRGISRDSLLERIWPEKDYSHAKDNFYSTWSMLNSLFSDGRKSSPYLSNKQGLCRLEPAFVTVDVYEFERLSKAILFQQGSVEERVDAIYRLEQLYRGDILSGTRIDGYIQAAQSRYRSILVDAMIEASKLFSQEGNDTNAVWFARKAYDTDPTREDVYRTLMSMQDKAGQRTSALKTYFDCKRFLSEELGILPSQKTIALYQELVLDRR